MNKLNSRTASLLAVLAIGLSSLFSTGCQIDIGGQTLPSAYYMSDDLQYFPAGPEFKLSNEAAAMKAAQVDQELSE